MKKVRNYTICFYSDAGTVFYMKRKQGGLYRTENLKEAIKFIDRVGANTFINKCLSGNRKKALKFDIMPLSNGLDNEKYVLSEKIKIDGIKLIGFYKNHRFQKGGNLTLDLTTADLSKVATFDSIEEAKSKIKQLQSFVDHDLKKTVSIVTLKEAEKIIKHQISAIDKDYGYILLHKSGKFYYFSEYISDKDKSVITEKIDEALWFEKLEDIQKFKKTLSKGVWHIAPLNNLMRYEGEEKSTYYLHNKKSKVDSLYQSPLSSYDSLSELKLDLAKNWKSDKDWFVSKYKAIVNLNMTSRTVPSKAKKESNIKYSCEDKNDGYTLINKNGFNFYSVDSNIRENIIVTTNILDAIWFRNLNSIEKYRKQKNLTATWKIIPYNDLLRFEGNEYEEYILYNTYEKYYYKGIDSLKKQIYVNLPEYAFRFKGISEVRKHLASHWKSAHSWKILRPAHGVKEPIVEKISYGIDIPKESTTMTLDEKINSLREYTEYVASSLPRKGKIEEIDKSTESFGKEIKNIKIRLDNIEHKVDAFLKDLKTSLERGL